MGTDASVRIVFFFVKCHDLRIVGPDFKNGLVLGDFSAVNVILGLEGFEGPQSSRADLDRRPKAVDSLPVVLPGQFEVSQIYPVANYIVQYDP